MNLPSQLWADPKIINLSFKHFFSENRVKGLHLDELWKKIQIERGAVIPKNSAAPWDANFEDNHCDVKLLLSDKFYISHNEYLFSKEHEIFYAIYAENKKSAILQAVFDSKTLHAENIFTREGRSVFCDRTKQAEVGWSVVFADALQFNLL